MNSIIPARFPYERPTFQFKVPLQHKFVEKSMNIFEYGFCWHIHADRHPSFTSPGAKNQSLLEIVSMIYEAFATDPPK